MKLNNSFIDYAKNITSQCGEDGIIEEIFNRIGIKHHQCVEFGAWDSINLSNTYNLWHNKGWKAILIEGDVEKAKSLKENTKDFSKVIPLNIYVDRKGPNSLDNILEAHHIPLDFDILSIDIDGDDYNIFESLLKYLPRLVVIEYNSTIPVDLDIFSSDNIPFGASCKALNRLAESKGYTLVHMTTLNLFFVRHADFHLLKIDKPTIYELSPNVHVTHIVSSYDGKNFMTRNNPIHCFVEELSFGNMVKYFLKKSIKTLLRIKKKPTVLKGDTIYPIKIFRLSNDE